MEWSLSTRDIEEEIVPLCRESHRSGFFGGKGDYRGYTSKQLSGTTMMNNLKSSIGSLRMKLTKKDLKEISDTVPIDEIAGDGISLSTSYDARGSSLTPH
ncbi:hypothetical protein CDL15_Pgr001599 [Punica granatum]|uniref:Uncharacterized protein n=1 Tax=Punica granatum TaxID=22663 RepID=A0A218X9W7_PUNGR|nr:hypothetical protein CDL15_Pgr001599 [Punica granatum]